MNEIVPGIVHWKAHHPNIGADVSCYYLVAEVERLDRLVRTELVHPRTARVDR